jgi:3-oxoacyl-[acyl-carrier-protein] synthase III
MKNCNIIGTGFAVPENIVTNDDLVKMGVDTNDEWIKSRTGIEERRILEEGKGVSSLAIEAAKKAIEDSGVSKSDIELVIVATTTPDYQLFPSVACLVQGELGLTKAAAFDLSAACSGFVYAVETGANFIKAGTYKKVLVIGADALSRNVDWEDRSICVLFGDGSGAVVLGEAEACYGILASDLRADGAGFKSLYVPVGGSKEPLTDLNFSKREHFVQMDGKKVFKFATSVIQESIQNVLDKSGLKKEDISLLILHQANKRIIDFAMNKFGLSHDKVYVNISKYGNTSSASIPIALDEARKKKLLKKGDIVVTAGFGAGLTWAANLIKWEKD